MLWLPNNIWIEFWNLSINIDQNLYESCLATNEIHDLSLLSVDSVDTFIKTPAAVFRAYNIVIEVFAMCAHHAFFKYADKRQNFWKRTKRENPVCVCVFVHVQDVPP